MEAAPSRESRMSLAPPDGFVSDERPVGESPIEVWISGPRVRMSALALADGKP